MFATGPAKKLVRSSQIIQSYLRRLLMDKNNLIKRSRSAQLKVAGYFEYACRRETVEQSQTWRLL